MRREGDSASAFAGGALDSRAMRPRWLVPLIVATALVGVVHCSSAGRVGFAEDPTPAGTTDASSGGLGGNFAEGGAPAEAGDGTCTEDIDVVLVLDVSSTMNFVLSKLESEIDKVVTASNALKAGAHFGLVVYADNGALSTTGDQSGGKVHTAAATLKSAFAYARTTYTAVDRNPGDGPTGPTTQNPLCEENALDALHMAATDFPWRSNAARVVIMATDDTFIEKPDNYGDADHDGKFDKIFPFKEGDYPARFTLDETVAALTDAKIRVFSFSALKPSGCGTGRRHTEADAFMWGWSKPYEGKPPIPEATGGKDFDLGAVKSGTVSLAATINEVVLQSHCAGPPK